MPRSEGSSGWLRELRSGSGQQPVLVCFPPGGGSASNYRSLAANLAPGPAVHAVQYPGRQDRLAEDPVSSIGELAAVIAAAMEPMAAGRPVLFGHSMGATVAFETARLLEAAGRTVAALFVSGRPDPAYVEHGNLHGAPDTEVIAELERLANDPASVRILREEPGIAEIVLPAVRNDYLAVETYRYAAGEPLGCDIFALLGRSDPTTTPEQLEEWRNHTTGHFEMRLFPGRHFYLDVHTREVADFVSSKLMLVDAPDP
ncbi:thioesterase II family protein [Nocardia sp. NPDC051750]|uniref:thioesterase II family protein n=1 Tax=Nocardia sp. NPDC051750 TaxID=3364325 RepID=UPI00379E95D2